MALTNHKPITDDVAYNEDYYRHNLHRQHWFHNNKAKMELRWREILFMLEPTAQDTIIDLGCATGQYTTKLAKLCKKVIGVDTSPSAIKLALDQSKSAANTEFVLARADSLDFIPNESVDKAMAIDFVEHINDLDLDRVQKEVWRILKPGGRFAIYTPCASHYVECMKAHDFILHQTPGHIAVRDEQAYRRLFSKLPWASIIVYFSPSTYPIFKWFDRLFSLLPWLGKFFRFRICIVLTKL